MFSALQEGQDLSRSDKIDDDWEIKKLKKLRTFVEFCNFEQIIVNLNSVFGNIVLNISKTQYRKKKKVPFITYIMVKWNKNIYTKQDID